MIFHKDKLSDKLGEAAARTLETKTSLEGLYLGDTASGEVAGKSIANALERTRR